MARITVEDCLENVDNRFDMVLIAAKRARQLSNGVDPLLPAQNDKPTVIALRELADGLIGQDILEAKEEVEESIDDELAAALAGELTMAEEPRDDF
jgi:DNA-directed RNA polymerase subunit omega